MTAPRSAQGLVGLLLFGLGLVIAPLGCGGLLSGVPVAMGFGLMFAVSSALLLHSGVEGIREGAAAATAERAQRARLEVEDRATTGLVVVDPEGELLAAWQVDQATWERFCRADLGERLPVAFGLALGVAVLGGALLVAQAPVVLAFGFAAVFGAGLAGLWLAWVTRARWQRSPRVRVADDAVLVGTVRHTLRSDMHRLDKVWLEEGDPAVLVFLVSWSTREGRSSDEVRVPVPEAYRADAQAVIAQMQG